MHSRGMYEGAILALSDAPVERQFRRRYNPEGPSRCPQVCRCHQVCRWLEIDSIRARDSHERPTRPYRSYGVRRPFGNSIHRRGRSSEAMRTGRRAWFPLVT